MKFVILHQSCKVYTKSAKRPYEWLLVSENLRIKRAEVFECSLWNAEALDGGDLYSVSFYLGFWGNYLAVISSGQNPASWADKGQIASRAAS
jgi:hypothetical protein